MPKLRDSSATPTEPAEDNNTERKRREEGKGKTLTETRKGRREGNTMGERRKTPTIQNVRLRRILDGFSNDSYGTMVRHTGLLTKPCAVAISYTRFCVLLLLFPLLLMLLFAVLFVALFVRCVAFFFVRRSKKFLRPSAAAGRCRSTIPVRRITDTQRMRRVARKAATIIHTYINTQTIRTLTHTRTGEGVRMRQGSSSTHAAPSNASENIFHSHIVSPFCIVLFQ